MTQTQMTRRIADTEPNPFGSNNGSIAPREAMVEVASSRASSEIQSAMVVAKKFPRDEQRAFQRIMAACQRKSLAEQAVYEYPRGDTQVNGPSIRLAEAMAQAWGNLDFGIIELEQRKGESSVMAYCWDLETNTRQTKVFTVKHERSTRRGNYALTDPRDIYELTANQGARRLRACILGIIPGDVVDAAVNECDKTMSGANKEPLADRVRKMLGAFTGLSVTQEMIEQRLNHKADSITERELLRLGKIYRAIRDNVAPIEDYFELAGGTRKQDVANETVEHRLGAGKAASPPPVKPTEPAAAEPADAQPDVRAELDEYFTGEPTGGQGEPPAASATESASEAGEGDLPDLSTFESWKAAAWEQAKAVGVNRITFDNAVKKLLLRHGKVGKGNELSQQWRDDHFRAIRDGVFDFNEGRIVEG